MNRRAAVAHVVLGAVLLAGTAHVSPGRPDRRHPLPLRDSLDLTASAQPSVADNVVTDQAYLVTATADRSIKSDNTATSTATCDGCVADSGSLEILYATASRQARLDNAAIAWNQDCVNCSSIALSVQVVVLRGAPATAPNNRALAVNAACDTCLTTAAAFQLVVVAGPGERLSAASVAELRAWYADQLAVLRASVPTLTNQPTAEPTPEPTPEPTVQPTLDPGPTQPRKVGEDPQAVAALGALGDLVNSDLGSRTVSADVDQVG